MGKMDNTTASAMNLYARLQGIDTNTINSNTEVEVEVEVDFENENKKKRKTVKKKSVEQPKRDYRVPDLEKFSKLRRDITIEVQQVSHDIHYKEQIWGIPSRMITYNLEVISNQKNAKDIAIMFKNDTAQDMKNAETGEVRYIRVVSYENIPYRSREIAYIRVTENNGVLYGHIILKKKQMKENNIDSEKVKKQLNKVMGELLSKGANNAK